MIDVLTQRELDAIVRETYEYAHACCHYGPTDRSFPVGEDGIMDCTGLMLRALWRLGLIHEALNCDEADRLMGRLGFVKTTDFEDVYRYHGFVQWVLPEWSGSEHVHHTFYSLGGDGQTISKYDTGSDARLRAIQPFVGVPADEWGGKYVFKHMWILPAMPDDGIYLQTGG